MEPLLISFKRRFEAFGSERLAEGVFAPRSPPLGVYAMAIAQATPLNLQSFVVTFGCSSSQGRYYGALLRKCPG